MKSPNLFTSDDDEGLEDGEIVSDDFEAISDDSIVFTPFGKSRTRKDPLPDLSLSSVSETEVQDPKLRPKRRKSRNKRRTTHKKRRRTISPNLDNSDSESIPDPDLQLKLKAAVQVGAQEAHRNSLRTRLKAIMKEACPQTPESDRQTPEVVEAVDNCRDVALVTGSGSEFESEGFGGDNAETDDTSAAMEELDSELIQLRIEALKTAVQNKFANKIKKKKEAQVSDETNKENNNVSPETSQEKNGDKAVDVPVVSSDSTENTPISPDEDEDILRALLLASMSNKITKIPSNDFTVAPKTETTKVPASKTLLTKVNNFKLNNNFKTFKTVPKKPVQPPIKSIVTPQVKPLIICLNDSDSDTEFSNSPEKIPTSKATAPVEKTIENSVEKFLKEQRARVEAQVKPIAPKVPPQRITLNKKPTILQTPLKTNLQKTLEKSALKFLPPNKREEYKRLQNLLRQKKAQMRKNKVRRNSIKISDGGPSAVIISDIKLKAGSVINTDLTRTAKTSVQNINKPVTPLNSHKVTNCTSRATQTENPCQLIISKLEERINEFRLQEESAARREQEKKEQSTLLRNILKQLQSRRNGRLQIEERYKSLRPLVKTLNQVSKEQKQCNEDVERLLRELAEARTRQQQLHDNLVKSVRELAQGKEKIDSCSSKVAPIAPLYPLITSTPIKPPTQNDNINLSSSTSDISQIHTEETVQPTKDCKLVSVTDPNDIDTIIKDAERRSAELEKCKKAGINQYISPLMDCSRRKDGFDPFGILCPFEVNGKCRDPDCGYNHLPK